ncbi:MAG TPA: MotA/TolQ/ExbB proton channel family protein [Planctomycetaceae bacterium]|nr:MotA/TolQ/ExbB proton channel family protein [Planctomycetaceae bacterium]
MDAWIRYRIPSPPGDLQCVPLASPLSYDKTSSSSLLAFLFLILILHPWAFVPSLHAAPEDASTAVEGSDDALPDGESADEDVSAIPTRNWLDIARDGGLLMLPIGACSIVLLVFVLERATSLRRSRVVPGPFVRRFLDQLREDELNQREALQLCRDNGSPVALVLEAAVKKWGRSAVEVEQAILDEGERIASRLRKHLRLFNGISTITPLLGMLGTVVGMIRAFNEIAGSNAMGRPEMLAGGIGQALLTTAAGLCVAIPALCAYLYFVGLVDKHILRLDSVGQQAVDLLASDGWREPNANTLQRGGRSNHKRDRRSAA